MLAPSNMGVAAQGHLPVAQCASMLHGRDLDVVILCVSRGMTQGFSLNQGL